MDEGLITVVLSADDAYARPLATAARSVLATLSPGRRLELCVLDMGITAPNRRAIEATFDDPRVDLRWVGTLTDRVTQLPNTWTQITRATYARLYIPEVLPNSERAVYLDCDVIAKRCVGDLFFTDMGGFAAMAVPDVQSPFVSSPYGVPRWFESGRSASAPNFNAGVMLMDLEAWRRDGLTAASLQYLTDGRHHFAQDQEAINVVLAGRIGELDPRWNQQWELFLREHEVFLPYSTASIRQTMAQPWILHYSNRMKPWRYGCTHPRLNEWFEHLDQTAFAGWRPTLTRKEKVKALAGKSRHYARLIAQTVGLW